MSENNAVSLAWELKAKAEKGVITQEEREIWEDLQRQCPVSHENPRKHEVDKDSCANCAAYLG